MALLATQTVVRAGLAPTYGAAAGGGDTFVPGERTFLHVKNGSGGALSVTVVAVGADLAEPDLLARDRVVSVPAGGERMIGPLSGSKYRNATTGVASITYSGVTSLTLAVLDVPA